MRGGVRGGAGVGVGVGVGLARRHLRGMATQRLRPSLERRRKRGREPTRLHARLEELRVERARTVGGSVAQRLGMSRRHRLPRCPLLQGSG